MGMLNNITDFISLQTRNLENSVCAIDIETRVAQAVMLTPACSECVAQRVIVCTGEVNAPRWQAINVAI
jgi:hypothetical protein